MSFSCNVYGWTQWRNSGHTADYIISLFGFSVVRTVNVLLLLFIFQATQTVFHALCSTDNSEYIGKVDDINLTIHFDETRPPL